jgi:DNA-binding transcriptional LysR family regulator
MVHSAVSLNKVARVGYTDPQDWTMFDLDAMETFVAVVRSGHFADASKELRLPRSTVSQRVARLEATLGVRLLERTTRVVRPTNAGAAYYERCARILSELEEANAAVKDLGSSPRGLLRVATPLLFGQSFLAPIAATFSQRYPEVEVEVVASDRRVNLIEEGFDVAIVVASSDPDSTLISRILSGGHLWCCATPSYLRSRGTPETPGELVDHDCIINREGAASGEARGARWTFERDEEVQRVDVRGRLRMNSMMMAHAAVLAGAGVATIPSFVCVEDIRSGRLVRILSDWAVDRKDIKIVYPSNRHLSPRVRLFVDALVMEYSTQIARSDEAAGVKRSRRAVPEDVRKGQNRAARGAGSSRGRS